MHVVRVVLAFLRVAVLNELQYRANFVLQLIQSLLALGTGLVILALVFDQVTDLNGWTHPQILAVMGVHVMMGGLIQMVIQPNVLQFMADIEEGTFDYVLTRPIDAQLLVSIRSFRIWQATDVLVGAVVLLIAVTRLGHAVEPAAAVLFAASFIVGWAMLYSVWLILATTAFWFVHVDQIVDLLNGFYQAGRWPVGIYPGWLRHGLTFLVPLAYAVTLPAEVLTSKVSARALAGAAAFAAVLVAFARWFWRAGLRRYASASS